MDDSVIVDGEQVKELRRKKGWTQARLAVEIGSVGVGWVRKIEAGKMVRMEWNGNAGVVDAGEDLAAALEVELDTLILDLLDGEKIKQFGAQRNWSPEQLAERAHVGVDVVNRAETGQYVRRVETRALAEAFDVPQAEILFKKQARELNFDAEDACDHMRAALFALRIIVQKRAESLGERIPSDMEALMEARGRIQFTLWKMGKDAGTEGSPGKRNSPYVLAIETAIGSEIAGRTSPGPVYDIVLQAKRIAAGHDKNTISDFLRCEQWTTTLLSGWIEKEGLDLDWTAPDADLQTVCTAGLLALAHVIGGTSESEKSEKFLKARVQEAIARLDFCTAFVSWHYQYFSRLSENEHGNFIGLNMLFVLGSHLAGMVGQRLSFLDALAVEEAAQKNISSIRFNTSASSR